jgi:hypothetical protein
MTIPVNPDLNDIAKQAHHACVSTAQRIGTMLHQLGAMLNADESDRFDEQLADIYAEVFRGTEPDFNEIADRAKYAYAIVTQKLAVIQYRLAELAAVGVLDPDESMRLQDDLYDMWTEIYFGTVYAIRDPKSDGSSWEQDDNTYSDGREMKVVRPAQHAEESESNWPYNRFLCADGPVT